MLAGLGEGSAIGEQIGQTITKLAPETGPAAPFVAAAGEIVSILSAFFGGGCGQTCVVAAQTEQVYEATADNILAVAKAGMMSGEDAISIMQNLITVGQQQETQNKPGAAGSANLERVIQGEIADAQSVGPPTQPLDLTAARELYVGASASQPGGVGAAGWEPGIVQAASQLTDQILSAGASASGGPSSGLLGVTSSGVAVLGSTIPWGLILLGAGAFFLLRG